MIKILFTSPVLEHPAVGGPALRIENSIKALSKICELSIVSRVPRSVMGGESAESFYKKFCHDFLYAPSARLNIANRYIRGLLREWRKLTGFKSDVRYLLSVIDKKNIDVLWCGYGNISFELIAAMKAMRPDVKIVCDTDSVWSRFVLRELPFENSLLRRKRIEKKGHCVEAWERRIVDLCEVTAAVSAVDAAYYRAIAKKPERIRIFSNVIDMETYQAVPSPVKGFKNPCIYLAGTFGHINSPMDRAARWMIEKVLPIVKRRIPGIHFYLVGKGSDVVWGKINDPSITVAGKVPSVLPYLCHADVAVVPLQFESGTRFKIMEAGACHVPIVSTALGAEGLAVVHERDILLADTPDDFADAIIRLIQDKNFAGMIVKNCHDLIRREYHVDALVKQAENIVRSLGLS